MVFFYVIYVWSYIFQLFADVLGKIKVLAVKSLEPWDGIGHLC